MDKTGRILIKITGVKVVTLGDRDDSFDADLDVKCGRKADIQPMDKIIDLMDLKKDIVGTLGIALPEGKTLKGFRIFTAESGHSVFDENGQQLCQGGVVVPSGSSCAGMKIHVRNLLVEPNVKYRLLLDFGKKWPVHPADGVDSKCTIHPSYQAIDEILP